MEENDEEDSRFYSVEELSVFYSAHELGMALKMATDKIHEEFLARDLARLAASPYQAGRKVRVLWADGAAEGVVYSTGKIGIHGVRVDGKNYSVKEKMLQLIED